MVDPVVEVRRADGGCLVAVVPPDPAYPAEPYAEFRRAWGAAGGIRLVTGSPKVDLTGDD